MGTTEEFQRDLSLMFLNAIMYNSSDHEVYSLTHSMQADTSKIVQEYLNTQALLKATDSKSRRIVKGETPPNPGGEGGERQRGRSCSGTGRESPVSSRARTTSSSQVAGPAGPAGSADPGEKRKRTSSLAEDAQAKKRRLRNVEES